MTTTQNKKVNDMRNLMACALAAGLLAACAGTTKTTKTAGSGTEGEDTGSMAGATERETISKAGADQIIPEGEEAQHLRRPARRLREGDEALRRRQERRRGLRAASAPSVSDAFKRVADDNPGLIEARFNQGAVLYECGREDEAARDLERAEVRPRDHQPRLHRLEEQRDRPRRVSVHRARSRTTLCTASRRATTSRRSCATRPARRGAPRRRSATSARRSATCAPCSRSTATTCRRSRRSRSSTTT